MTSDSLLLRTWDSRIFTVRGQAAPSSGGHSIGTRTYACGVCVDTMAFQPPGLSA